MKVYCTLNFACLSFIFIKNYTITTYLNCNINVEVLKEVIRP